MPHALGIKEHQAEEQFAQRPCDLIADNKEKGFFMPSSRGGFFLPQAPETLGELLLVLHLQLKLTNQPKLKPKPKQKTGICLIGLSDIVLPVALKLQSVPEISEKFMKTQTVGSTLQGRDTCYCSDKCSKEILGYLTWCEQTLDFLPPEPTFLSLFGFPVHA